MGLSCGAKVGKVFLIIINSLLSMFGTSLLTVGILMKVKVENVEFELNPTTAKLNEHGAFTDNVAIGIIVLGGVIFLVAALGLAGACSESSCMLITYGIIVLLLLLVKIAAIALWFTKREEVEEFMKMEMLESLKANYVNDTLDSDKEISNLWNNMFLTSDCCAVNPVTGNDTDFKETPWCKEPIECNVPRTCCVGVDATSYTRASANCTSAVSGYKTMGCFDALKEGITSRSLPIIGVGAAILFIELLAVIFAFVICSQSDQD